MNDVLPDPSATLEAQRVRRRRASDHMWLERGANRNWGWPLVAGGVGALALGLGVFWFLTRSATSPVAWFTANVVLWAVLLAFRLSIPRQLFRFRWADVILGVSVGLMVRMLADVLLRSERGFLPWPTLADGTGQLPALWWLDSIVSSALAAPVVEELFFRAFLLVALYAVFCRITGSPRRDPRARRCRIARRRGGRIRVDQRRAVHVAARSDERRRTVNARRDRDARDGPRYGGPRVGDGPLLGRTYCAPDVQRNLGDARVGGHRGRFRGHQHRPELRTVAYPNL